jgi:hypothetical protein
MRKLLNMAASLGFLVSTVAAVAHAPGPGMVITCQSDSDPKLGASVTATNASTGKSHTQAIPPLHNAAFVCTTIMNTCTAVGLNAKLEGVSAVAVYGSKNVVNVTGASVVKSNF